MAFSVLKRDARRDEYSLGSIRSFCPCRSRWEGYYSGLKDILWKGIVK